MLFFMDDVLTDFVVSKTNSTHFYFELFFVVALMYLLITQVREIYSIKTDLVIANDKLTILKEGLSEAIDNQFNIWKLTNAEREVALLVIKGFSFAKISELRSVSEKTIHQQISSVYKKSNTKNRHEFMSGFLEDFINY